MASLQERTRNNVRAGIFVSITLALAFFVLLLLGEAWTVFTPRRHYAVRFSVQDGVEGLNSGSEVRVGGMVRGRVTKISPEQEEGPLTSILVSIEVDRAVDLYSNAVAFRIAPILGNAAWINFPDVGNAAAGSPIPDGAILDAAQGLGLLTTLLGPENAAAAGRIVSNTEEFSEFLADVRGEYDGRVAPILDNAGEIVAAAKTDYKDWSAQVTRILNSVVSAAEKADGLMDDGRSVAANLNGGIDDVRDLVKANRPAIDKTIGNVADASEDVKVITNRIRLEAVDAAVALLNRGREGVDSFASLMEKAEVELDALSPQIRQIAADGRLAAQQLKLATIEVRRSPWKLLYRPSTDELEGELLYEAARSFALAAGDLRASTESFERVMDNHADLLQQDQGRLESMQTMLTDSFERYQKAQQHLLDILIQSQDSPAQP